MHHIDPNDPFYTSEVIADIRKSILMRISKDKDTHRLERIQKLLESVAMKAFVLDEDSMQVSEPEAVYYTMRDVDSIRQRLHQKVAESSLEVIEEIFSYYDHDGMTFKDAYLDAKAWNTKMFPAEDVEELAEVNFMIDRDPEPDDWHEPQTKEEWEALDKELDEATDYISGEEFWRTFEKFLK